jgi:hypothetical protein
MKGLSERELVLGLSELGITPQQIQAAIRGARTLPEANERLDAIKADARRAFKRKALELHPDRTGGDSEKEALFKKLQHVVEAFSKISVRVQQPRPQPAIQIRVYTGGFNTSTTTSATHTWTGGGTGGFRGF